MTEIAVKYYLFEIRTTDGNDCLVYDAIVDATNQDEAQEKIGKHFDDLADKNGWESDGNFGYYSPCDCEAPEEPTDDPAECEDCEVLCINGVNCHETDCPTYRQYCKNLKEFERFEDRECEHGGLTISDQPMEFDTEDEAEQACARYHSRYWL